MGFVFFSKQKTAYEMRISDWSSDVCSSDLLLLGGTGEALRLARELEGNDRLHCISSLAGRTEQPVQPPGAVRVGGFGGIAGLSDYLVREKIDLVLDATHPFAEQMARHAFEACREIGRASCRARVCQYV